MLRAAASSKGVYQSGKVVDVNRKTALQWIKLGYARKPVKPSTAAGSGNTAQVKAAALKAENEALAAAGMGDQDEDESNDENKPDEDTDDGDGTPAELDLTDEKKSK